MEMRASGTAALGEGATWTLRADRKGLDAAVTSSGLALEAALPFKRGGGLEPGGAA